MVEVKAEYCGRYVRDSDEDIIRLLAEMEQRNEDTGYYGSLIDELKDLLERRLRLRKIFNLQKQEVLHG